VTGINEEGDKHEHVTMEITLTVSFRLMGLWEVFPDVKSTNDKRLEMNQVLEMSETICQGMEKMMGWGCISEVRYVLRYTGPWVQSPVPSHK
jgi:hypothetical protein